MRMSRVRDENLYNRWNTMKQRCFNPNNQKHKSYGGRGITICDEWMNYENFKIWALATGYAEHLTLDRIDTDGNYNPWNCRWVNQKVQQNNRRNNRRIIYKGKSYTLAELSDLTGIKSATIALRLNEGMTPREAVETELNHDYIFVEMNGEKHYLKKWCEILKLPYKTVHMRIKRGWTPEKALTTPIRKGNYKRSAKS